MRALTARGWGAIAAVALLIAVAAAALVSSTAVRGSTPADGGGPQASPRRCRDFGSAAENDPACHGTWRRLGDRFLSVGAEASSHE